MQSSEILEGIGSFTVLRSGNVHIPGFDIRRIIFQRSSRKIKVF